MRHRMTLPAVPAPGSVRRSRWLPPDVRSAVVTAAVAVTMAGLPVGAASASGPAGESAAVATAAGQATGSTVPLVTGGQVVVATAGGQPCVAVRGAAGAGAAVWYQDAAGDRFLVPVVAVPYLGRQLSPSLFDVSALARDRITGAARIPVALRSRAVPGWPRRRG